MFNKRTDIAIFFTDEIVGFFQRQPFLDQAAFGTAHLEKGAIENGYIKEPESVLETLRKLLEKYQVYPRSITLIIHDENLLIRDIKIKREELVKKTIDQYFADQLGKTLHFPYPEPVITHFVREESEELIRVIALITDGHLLHAYHDIFDKLKAKEVLYEISAVPFYNIYHNKVSQLDDITMFVNLYNGMFSIQILEKGFPIFNMIEENDGGKEEYAQMIENYVERIANYYKFNLRKGKQHIAKVLIFNMNEDVDDEELQKLLVKKLSSYKAQLCTFNVEETFSKLLPKACKLPYAVLLGESYRDQNSIDFKLERIPRNRMFGHQLMVVAFAIVVFMLLVYIPYYAMSEEIKLQQNRNNALQMQLDMLIEETPQTSEVPVVQLEYNRAYTYIMNQQDVFTGYLLDIIDLQTPSVTLTSYQVRPETNEIAIFIQANTEQELYEFIISLYETHGVVDEPTSSRWITETPTYRFTAALTMEVTISYA
jgi:uncharacterized protein YoxC